MTEELALEKAKHYLIKLKKSKILKKSVELLEIQNVIEQLDSMVYKIRKERKNKDEFR